MGEDAIAAAVLRETTSDTPVCDRWLGSEFTDFASDVDAVAGVLDRGTETLELPTSTTPS